MICWVCFCVADRWWNCLICCCLVGVCWVTWCIFRVFFIGALLIFTSHGAGFWVTNFLVSVSYFIVPKWCAFVLTTIPPVCSTPFFSCIFLYFWKWLHFIWITITNCGYAAWASFYLFVCCFGLLSPCHKSKVYWSWSNFYGLHSVWPCGDFFRRRGVWPGVWTCANSYLFERCFEL